MRNFWFTEFSVLKKPVRPYKHLQMTDVNYAKKRTNENHASAANPTNANPSQDTN